MTSEAPPRHEVAEYALLGLLRDGPCHGYRLAEAFEPEGRLRAVLRLKMSQLYAYLRKLERQGWLRASEEQPGAARTRRVFALTEEGARAFDTWLAQPVAATREVRLDFLVKLAFTIERDRAAASDLLTRQRAATSDWLERLRARRAVTSATSPLDPGRVALSLRIRQSEATLAWLDELAVLLAQPTG